MGFTLVEMIVITGIIAIVSVVVASTFFATLKGAAKTTITNSVKQNGDLALSVIENTIRSAVDVTASGTSCTSGFSGRASITLTNPNNTQTTLSCPVLPETRIGVLDIPPIPTPTTTNFLTSTAVMITSCSFSCTKQTGLPAVVKIFFIVSQPITPGITYAPQERASIPFETSIVVRNFQ